MNRVLVEIFVQFALFLEFASEDQIELETKVRLEEEYASRLQRLVAADRIEFCRVLREVAAELTEGAPREYLEKLPGFVGIEDEE